jgi:DNA gyrase subunit A
MDLLNQDSLENIKIEETLQKSYLDYSMSVIVGRALPDVRDGLKPVHRRILYSMNELSLSARSPYKKSARITGDTLGKYHPHGDSAVYEALVRMAQDFSMRVPIVDGQGNFGSIDGDNAAAQRYTEARMTNYAEELLKDIDKNTVEFVPNYDDSLDEPSVLPSRVPNLLVNGSNGIAVGMATNIPPHRLDEIIDATIMLLENPKTSVEELMTVVKGPDFPTGGIIFGKQGIVEAYKTGRGRVKIRAKIHGEQVGTREAIIIDELPYQVNKSRLIEQIATLVKTKAIEGISDIRDESDKKGIRVVIELKKGVIREILENNLFKSTNMETTFGINILAIKNREPRLFNLAEALTEFISHRKSVVIRRTLFELQKAEAKAHILEGLQKALASIDEVVKIVKGSKNSELAKTGLIERFEFSPKQASAILDMRLQKLTSLESNKLLEELNDLHELIKYLKSILGSEDKLKDVIRDELIESRDRFSSPRRTSIEDNYDDIDAEDLIPNLPMVVTITNNGYVKRVPLSNYEKQNRGGKGKTALTTYEDDFVKDFFTSNSHDTLLIITNFGQLFWLKVYKIPEASRQAKGKAIVNLIHIREGEEIKAIIPTDDLGDDKSLVFFTRNGVVKRTNLAEFSNIRANGVRAINLDEDDQLVTARIMDGDSKYISIFTSLAQAIKFDVEKTRDQGRSTRGVTGIKFKKEGDFVVDGIILKSDKQEILTVSENGLGKRSFANEYRLTNRAGSGVISMKLSNRAGKSVIGAVVVEEDKELMILTESGKLIRISFDDISTTSRNTAGVTLVTGDKVLSISKSPKDDAEEELVEGEEEQPTLV